MGTNGINTIISDTSVSSNKVMSITFEALDQLSVARFVVGLPRSESNNVTIGVESGKCSSTTTSHCWIEVVGEWTTQACDRGSNGTEEDQVHQVSFFHIGNHFVRLSCSGGL